MRSTISTFAAWVKATSSRTSYNQGVRCARNQIATVLICGFAITSLFYPALGVLVWKHSGARGVGFWTVFEEQGGLGLDTSRAGVRARDVRVVWDDADGWKSVESACELDGPDVLRLERLLIPISAPAPSGDYSGPSLAPEDLAVISAAHSKLLPLADSLQCLHSPLSPANCLILAHPDLSIPDSALIPSPSSSITRARKTGQHFAVFTLFFSEDCAAGSQGHADWLAKLWEEGRWDLEAGSGASHVVHVEYVSPTTPVPRSPEPYIFAVGYALFLVYVVMSVSRLNQVHSRFGLAFTGLVQLCVSTIMSISVLALCGWNLVLVPWSVVPFVIVVVGVENMLTIARSVVATSISLPVPERIGKGMENVGPTITMTVLSDLVLLGLAGWFAPGVVREFCIFASVVTVIDYFLQSTFFVAILSVDIQRLELADLIHQGLHAPAPPTPAEEKASPMANESWLNHPLVEATKVVWKARSTRNASLSVLLAIMGILYYLTLPVMPLLPVNQLGLNITSPPSTPTSLIPYDPFATALPSLPNFSPDASPSELLWSALNPNQHKSITVRLPPPTLLVPEGARLPPPPPPKLSRLAPRTRALMWIGKIVVLPIASTLFALYLLLLYLLKDKELHELQRSKLDAQQAKVEPPEKRPLLGVKVRGLPRRHRVDVELVVASDDGAAVLSVGLDNRVTVWLGSTGKNHTLYEPPSVIARAGSAQRLPTSHARISRITSVAVDRRGRYAAAGTASGNLLLWKLAAPFPQAVRLNALPSTTRPLTAVSALTFVDLVAPAPVAGSAPPTPASALAASRAAAGQEPVFLLAAHASGEVQEWCCLTLEGSMAVDPVRERARVSFLPDLGTADDRRRFPLLALARPDGKVELWRRADAELGGLGSDSAPAWNRMFAIHAEGAVEQVKTARIRVNGKPRLVVALGLVSGVVALFDARTERLIANLPAAGAPLERLHLVSMESARCASCGDEVSESLFIISSTPSTVSVNRLFVRDPAASGSCACPSLLPCSLSADALSTTFISSPTPSPSRLRGRSARVSASESSLAVPSATGVNYPLASHGFPRRVSQAQVLDREKRESSYSEDADANGATFTGSGPPPDCVPPESPPDSDDEISRWGDVRVQALGSTSIARGSWTLLGGSTLVGVRRKQRTAGGSCRRAAPWEVWSTNLARGAESRSDLFVNAADLALGGVDSDMPLSSESDTASQTSSSLNLAQLPRLAALANLGLSDDPISPRGGSPRSSEEIQRIPLLPFARIRTLVATSAQPTTLFVALGNAVAEVALDLPSAEEEAVEAYGDGLGLAGHRRRGSGSIALGVAKKFI